jgi:hypothetical protein
VKLTTVNGVLAHISWTVRQSFCKTEEVENDAKICVDRNIISQALSFPLQMHSTILNLK